MMIENISDVNHGRRRFLSGILSTGAFVVASRIVITNFSLKLRFNCRARPLMPKVLIIFMSFGMLVATN